MPSSTIGGQAVIEGVMMRSKDRYAIAVRRPNKKIVVKTVMLPKRTSRLENIPIVRGCIRFGETLVIGIKSLEYSASESAGIDDNFTSKDLAITLTLSTVLTVGLFFAAPLFFAQYLVSNTGLAFNIADGIIRLSIFLAYLIAISFLPDIKRIFQYHGAEHMTVFCYEAKKPLTVKNVKTYSTLHPRCGTNFIIIVMIISILMFTVINVQSYLLRLVLRLALLPFIAGIAYEILRFAGSHYGNVLVKVLVAPGLLLQKITTKKPTDDMIQVAIKALKAAQ